MKDNYKLNKNQRLKKEIFSLNQKLLNFQDENKNIKDILSSTLHEVRRFSAQLSMFAERLCRDTEEEPRINQTANSIFYIAGMISSRLAYTDIELNPQALASQTTIRAGIFKKFHKATRIMTETMRDRQIKANIQGECYFEIEALPVFELLPFVLLENAIKYSPSNQDIFIKFDETENNKIIVTIDSIGPMVSDEELPKLFDRGFRGQSVHNMSGEGLGLFLAEQVCNFHDFSIKAHSSPKEKFRIDGVIYSEFNVTLEYKKF